MGVLHPLSTDGKSDILTGLIWVNNLASPLFQAIFLPSQWFCELPYPMPLQLIPFLFKSVSTLFAATKENTGLAKKFIQVFSLYGVEKPEQTFCPTQYLWKFFRKVKIELPHDTIPLWHLYKENTNTNLKRYMHHVHGGILYSTHDMKTT